LTEAQDSFFEALDQYTLADLVPEPQAYVPLLVQGR
jgi:DNA-binding IscR family transcriptional regulator